MFFFPGHTRIPLETSARGTREEQLQPGCFGENLFLHGDGFDAATLCVGDVLQGWRHQRATELRQGWMVRGGDDSVVLWL